MLYVEYYYTVAHAPFLVRVDGLLLLRALASPFLVLFSRPVPVVP